MPKPLRVISGGPVNLTRRRAAPGGVWLTQPRDNRAPILRGRIGLAAQAALFGGGQAAYGVQDPNRVLNTEQLRQIYLRTPDVRSAIDQITRRVATWNWGVEPALDPSSDGYQDALDLAEESRRFLAAPNYDGETWQEVLTKIVTDLLQYDAGVLELVGDSRETLQELVDEGKIDAALAERVTSNERELSEIVALRGGDIRPVVDEHGRLLGYNQDVHDAGAVLVTSADSGSAAPKFKRDQLVYFRLFPNTSSPEGTPLIETLLNEVIAILRSSEHAMLALDADEIPPGLLVLMGISGQAAKQAKQDLASLRGRDHKLRVMTTADPKATGAKWVELRRNLKDVDFVPVVKEIRRTIWRLFGVMPVEMGESEALPRAVGEVQLEVGSSHLINPILELIEAKVNARIMPAVVGDPERVGEVRFFFDREAKLSPAEQKDSADRLTNLVDGGIMTRNEARAEQGLPPAGESADVLTVTTGVGPVRLDEVVARSPDRQPPSVPGEGGDDDGTDTPSEGGDDGVEQPEAGEPEAGEEAPGEVQAACIHAERGLELPSEWQPGGRFDGARTLDLRALGETISRYTRTVLPLYHDSRRRVEAIVRSAYEPGGWSSEAAGVVSDRIGAELDRLVARWTTATAARYQDAAKNGRDSASDHTGQPVIEDWRERGAAYGERAMGFLVAPEGLVGTLRAEMAVNVAAFTRSLAAPYVRAAQSDIDLESGIAKVLAGFMASWWTNEHRVENWSGRLVELATQMLVDGTEEASTVVDPEEGLMKTEWWAAWEAIGDEQTCATCDREAAAGFRPLSSFTTTPGGDTECRARCRCVTVLWRKEEVQDGTAVRLAGYDDR